MASTSAVPPTAERKAKRTHARRSCDLCKKRKTRCELPDLDVPSSSDPLPFAQACHRCRVLDLPCIVDDSRMKRPRDRKAGTSAGPSSSTSASKRASASTGRTPSEGPLKRSRSSVASRPSSAGRTTDDWEPVNMVNHDVELSAAFQIPIPPQLPQPQQWESPQGSVHSGLPSVPSSPAPRNVRLHGRPLSLVGALLSITSSGTHRDVKRRVVIVDDVDLEQVIPQSIRARLAPGYAQLRTYHPHLQPLSDLFRILRETPGDSCVELLLAAAVFVASQSLGSDPEAHRLRELLAPTIHNLQHIVLAHQPGSFHAIQALELLTLHAPFSPTLPFQLTDPTTLGPARGVVGTALNIATSLNFNAMVNGPLGRWPNPDFWLWLGLRASEAQMAFEDERPRKPALLGEARALAWALTAPENDQQWLNAATMDDLAELLGKLAVSDRLARLEELHDTYSRLRGILGTVTNVANFGAQQAVAEEVDYYNSRLSEIDGRHDKIIGMLSLPGALESGWKAYRVIRRRWEAMKVYLVAFQTLVALHFLPGSGLALSGLPAQLTAATAIHHAMSRASQPHDILVAYASTTMAADDLRRLSKYRGAEAEHLINTFIELAPTLLPGQGNADLVPLHDIIAMVVESAKVLMEQHASSLTYYRSINALPSTIPTPSWVSALSQLSQILRGLSSLRVEEEDNLGGGENIASGCSNLLASMVRIVYEWSAMVGRDGGASIPSVPALAGSSAPILSFGLPETSSPIAMGAELVPPVDPVPMRSSSAGAIDSMISAQGQGHMSAGGFQSYMPTSDRWMSTDERSMSLPPPQSASTTMSTPVLTSASGDYMQQAQPPIAQDSRGQGEPFGHILTEMFGYNSYGALGSGGQPPTPQQSSPFDPRGQVPPPPMSAVSLHHPHGHLGQTHPVQQQPQPPHPPPHGPPPHHQQQQQQQQQQQPQGATFQLMPHGNDESGAR